MATTVGWSALPTDLFWSILKRLRIADYIRAGAVCVSWRHLLLESHHPPAPQVPWLMISHKPHNTIDFFSMSENMTYSIDLPDTIGGNHRFIGSSAGWLISVDDASELHMFNPLSMAHLRLPSITTLGNIASISYTPEGKIAGYYMDVGHGNQLYNVQDMRNTYLKKAVVSSSDSRSFTVVAICNFSSSVSLIFTRSGDQRWKAFKNPGVHDMFTDKPRGLVCTCFDDTIFYHDNLYAVSRMGSVVAWDMSSQVPRVTLIVPEPCYMTRCQFKYLVESPDGHLLQVQRDMGFILVFVMTAAGKRIHYEYRDKYWSRITTLGNYALFLGQNHSLALSPDGISEMRRNCIYFTDNSNNNYFKDHEHEWDVTKFDMEKGTHTQYYQSGFKSCCPSIWFTPKMTPPYLH